MIQKQYDADRTSCKVTFTIPSSVKAATVAVVGDFNEWDRHATPMERLPDGNWKAVVTLDCGRDYHFRYLVNDREWHNEWEADRYAVHPLGGENSVISIW
jgi:1,4-alpha-glucan branching enzyme